MKSKFFSWMILSFSFTNLAIAQSLPAYVDTVGLVGWYPFNGNANDVSGKGNNGTIYGGATSVTDRFGIANQALYFDGIDDYVSIPRNPSLEPTTELTINAWIKPTRLNNTGWRTLVSKPYSPGMDPYISFSIQTSSNSPINNKWQFNLSNGSSGSLKSLLATNALDDNDSLMITAILSNSLMKLYINGNLDTTLTFNGSIGYSNQDLLIGYSLGGQNEYYKGSIDELGIWNRALTTLEIEKLVSNGGCLPGFPINANKNAYNLDEKAIFSISPIANGFYQWQANPLQLGWMNIADGISFTGAWSIDLSAEKITAAHHQLPIRVIAQNSLCSDTSSVKEIEVIYCLADTLYVTDSANNDTLFISIATGINYTEPYLNRILVYPNPARTQLNFGLEKPGSYKAELTGVSGSVSIQTSGSFMDISSLSEGVYILRIYDEENRLVSTNKIVILR